MLYRLGRLDNSRDLAGAAAVGTGKTLAPVPAADAPAGPAGDDIPVLAAGAGVVLPPVETLPKGEQRTFAAIVHPSLRRGGASQA